ncbi:MAG: hypothetical protein A2054_09650 [Deltaproteobacteria bacterium GWA2_55_10]|nr:MAG: hypothetical protein A2054_09650 [Deltaproteobacteria bacterium GWA2_55_10]
MEAEAAGKVIDAESHREVLENILMNYGLGPESLEFTDSFPNEPMKVAKCVKIARKITFKKVITQEEKEAVLAGELSLFPEEVKGIQDDLVFLKHTLLKYICGIQQRWQPDHECAKWAFYHVKKN